MTMQGAVEIVLYLLPLVKIKAEALIGIDASWLFLAKER